MVALTRIMFLFEMIAQISASPPRRRRTTTRKTTTITTTNDYDATYYGPPTVKTTARPYDWATEWHETPTVPGLEWYTFNLHTILPTVFTRGTQKPVAYTMPKSSKRTMDPYPTRVSPDEFANATDDMTRSDKGALINMIEDLLKDSVLKLNSETMGVRESEQAMGFSIGSVMGLIQARYRTMLEIYREVTDKQSRWGGRPRTQIWPAMFQFDNIFRLPNNAILYYIVNYELIMGLNLEIEQLVRMLLDIPRDKIHMPHGTPVPIIITKRKRVKTRRPLSTVKKRNTTLIKKNETTLIKKNETKGLRSPQDEESRLDDLIEQERYKHNVREQYIVQALNLNGESHTPKPRFIKGWPVDDTWDELLNQYG